MQRRIRVAKQASGIKKQETEFYSAEEVAMLFGVTMGAVYAWVHDKRIPFVDHRLPGSKRRRPRFPRRRIDAMIAARAKVNEATTS